MFVRTQSSNQKENAKLATGLTAGYPPKHGSIFNKINSDKKKDSLKTNRAPSPTSFRLESKLDIFSKAYQAVFKQVVIFDGRKNAINRLCSISEPSFRFKPKHGGCQRAKQNWLQPWWKPWWSIPRRFEEQEAHDDCRATKKFQVQGLFVSVPSVIHRDSGVWLGGLFFYLVSFSSSSFSFFFLFFVFLFVLSSFVSPRQPFASSRGLLTTRFSDTVTNGLIHTAPRVRTRHKRKYQIEKRSKRVKKKPRTDP